MVNQLFRRPAIAGLSSATGTAQRVCPYQLASVKSMVAIYFNAFLPSPPERSKTSLRETFSWQQN
jgi:hypothetical protein